MPHSEIVEKYLTRVILFKEKQEHYTDFSDESKRAALLRKLFDDLDFDDHLWALKSEIAVRAFKIYEYLDSDYEISHTAPVMYQALLEKYLKRAIALDPYNTEYLRAYFSGPVGNSKKDKKLAIHYISLYHPNSSEFQNLLVDLKLKPGEVTFDYLGETVTAPFVNELVFLRQKAATKQVEIQSEKKLEELAKTAGLDSGSLQEIKESVPELLTTAMKVMDNPWLDWTTSYKAFLAMEKALDLAPYNKEVLLAAVSFYGGFFWRLLLGYRRIKRTEGKEELMEYVFGVKKPKQENIYLKATEFFERTLELKERLYQVILKEESEQVKKRKDDFSGPDFLDKNRFDPIRRSWMRYKEANYTNIQSYVEKETLTFQLLGEHFKSKKSHKPALLFVAIPTAIIGYLFSWWLFKTPVPFFPFLLPAILLPMLVLYLKEKIWEYKKFNLEEVLEPARLRY